jgi:site-specific recombinase XerD
MGVYERFKGSNVWYVRWSDSNGKIRRERVGPKSAALTLYNKRRTQVHLQEKLPESFRVKSVTFGKLAESALAWSKANKRSYADDVCRMKRLTDEFGSRGAEQIKVGEFERFLSSREWSDATPNRYKALLKLVYRLAERDELVQANPARKLRLATEQGRVRWLSDAEELQLRKFIPPVHLPEFDLSIHTGLRRSEQYNLEWKDVDLERAILTIPRSKNGETRYVPLNSVALDSLRVLKNGDDGRVFSLTSPRYWFESAIGKAKIKDYSWHSNRHTYASRLVMAGVDIRTVSALLGHKSIGITMRYSHLAEPHLAAAVEKLAKKLT